MYSSDIDLPGDTLTYGLSGGDDMALFSINAAPGSLSLNLASLPQGLNFEAPIDADQNGLYLVEVSVTDGKGGIDKQLIRLTVTNSNEVPTGIGGLIAAWPENTDTSSGMIVLSASDLKVADQDLGDTHTLTIVGGADAARFNLIGVPGYYQLAFNSGVLNFEAQPSFSVNLRATDSANLWVEHRYTLGVLNVNEAPTLSNLAVTINENPLTGLLLGSMSFQDEDNGDTLTVRILPPSAGSVDASLLAALSIDATGQVRITDPALFDYESKLVGFAAHQLHLKVEITDAKGVVSAADLTVTLNDLNEAPSDVKTVLQLNVNSPGDVIGSLVASDQDNAEQFSYALTDNPGNAFAVNASTGAISLTPTGQSLLSTGRTETLSVTVTDKGGLQVSRTFALKMPDYFPPQTSSLNGNPTGNGTDNPGVLRTTEAVVVSGTVAAPTSATIANSRARALANEITTLSDLGLNGPTLGNTSSQEVDDGFSRNSKSRNRRFEDAVTNTKRVQAFTIEVGTKVQINEYGGFNSMTPELVSSLTPTSIDPSGALASFGGRFAKPTGLSIGSTGGDSDPLAHNEETQDLIRLIGREPIYIASAVISAGAVWWAARGLALVTAMVMGAPAWRQVDLLPVVLVRANDMHKEDLSHQPHQDEAAETIATTSFFNAADGDLEEEAVASLFEVPDRLGQHG